MDGNKKESVKNSLGRALFVGVSLILQVGWIVGLVMKVNDYYAQISIVTSFLALAMVLRIYGKHQNGAIKTSWIILILLFPVFGLCLYFLVGRTGATKGMRRRFEKINTELDGLLVQDEALLAELTEENPGVANQCRYIARFGPYPVYRNTDVVFYADAADGLEAQKEELRKAEKFIFMEYHAIEDSQSFHGLEEILAEKAAQGVDVRLFYDDMGSIGFVSGPFVKRMREKGIQCRVFNPLLPIINVFMNNRDHRKITVVDGRVGFTGGYNLADEYFNLTHPFGQWKDTGLKLTGDAVRSLTVMFLEMWNAMEKSDADYERFLPPIAHTAAERGCVQPYADSPLDDERVGENVYMNMVKNAKHYVYVMTPYLILDDEMNYELGLAAKRGVDVRVMTPGIPDKKLVYGVTRSYYAGLVRDGVRMYEYTPGFVHAKEMLCDGETAAVGTINLDYRSLYHHFENGAFLYNCSAIEDIRRDFDETLTQCREVTADYSGKRSAVLRGKQCLLRLFAPLM